MYCCQMLQDTQTQVVTQVTQTEEKELFQFSIFNRFCLNKEIQYERYDDVQLGISQIGVILDRNKLRKGQHYLFCFFPPILLCS